MKNLNQPVLGDNWCLATNDRSTHVLYVPNTRNAPRITLQGNSNARFNVRWYNPRSGGRLQIGSVRSVPRGNRRNLGLPPGGSSNDDWVVLLRRTGGNGGPTTTRPPRTTTRPPRTTTRPPRTTTRRPRPTTTRRPANIVPSSPGGTVSGSLRVGGEVRLGFVGPNTRDQANPPPDARYRMTIWVFAPDNSLFSVTGQFAGNGDLSRLNRNDKQGNIWLATFRPTQRGRYWWSAEFRLLNGGREETAGFFDDFFDTLVVQ